MLFPLRSYGQGKSLWKVGQTSRSRSLGQILRYVEKGIVTRNTQVKYESPIYTGSEVKAKEWVFVHTYAGGMSIELSAYSSRRAKREVKV